MDNNLKELSIAVARLARSAKDSMAYMADYLDRFDLAEARVAEAVYGLTPEKAMRRARSTSDAIWRFVDERESCMRVARWVALNGDSDHLSFADNGKYYRPEDFESECERLLVPYPKDAVERLRVRKDSIPAPDVLQTQSWPSGSGKGSD